MQHNDQVDGQIAITKLLNLHRRIEQNLVHRPVNQRQETLRTETVN